MATKSRLLRLVKNAVRETDWSAQKWRHPDMTKILVPFRMMLHPVSACSEIKYEGRGSLALANLLALLYLLCGVLRNVAYGFVYNQGQQESFNLWPVFVQTIGILLMWLLSSWSLSTLMSGEGKLGEIWITTCYAMLPTILLTLPTVALTNVFVAEEAAIIALLETLMAGWSIFLLVFATLVVQQYTLKKTLLMMLLTVIGIVCIVFLIILFFSLFQQLYIFLDTVFREVLTRMP